MVVWEIGVGGNPTNPAHVHAGIVPVHKNHIDTEATLIPENHVDAGTVLILKNQVDIKIVHVRAGMLTKVRIPQKTTAIQCNYGCYESCLTKSRLVAVLR